MKTTLTFLMMYVIINVFAQSDNNYLHFKYEYSSDYQLIKFEPQKDVAQICYIQNNKNKKDIIVINKFDSLANLIEYQSKNLKDKILQSVKYEYDKSGHIIKEIIFKTDSSKAIKSIVERNEKGSPSTHKVINSNGKIIEKNLWFYDNNGKLIESSKFKGNGKLINKWLTEYDENGNKLKTTLLDNRNNPIKIWLSCILRDTLNNDLVINNTTVKNNEKINQSISKWNISDTATIYKVYDCIVKITNDKISGNPLLKEVSENNIITEKIIYEYSNNLLSKEVYYYHDKLQKISEYTYNGEYLKELKLFNNKNQLISNTVIVYN